MYTDSEDKLTEQQNTKTVKKIKYLGQTTSLKDSMKVEGYARI